MSDAPDYAAPARREDVTGLAPACVGVGDLDLFYDEAVTYAQRLRSAGIDSELMTVPGMCHGAEALARKLLPSSICGTACSHICANI